MSKSKTARPFHPAMPFIVAYGLCVIVQVIGGHYTQMSVTDWYPTLNKSPLTPPGMWFGIVWTILYILMAVAAARVARITGQFNNRPLRWWLVQLFTGLVWTMVFFGHRDIENGMVLISFGWVATLLSVLFFWRVDRVAGLLLVPLLGWISFASYLNFYILQHN